MAGILVFTAHTKQTILLESSLSLSFSLLLLDLSHVGISGFEERKRNTISSELNFD